MANFIRQLEGFDGLPLGPLNSFPWQGDESQGQVVADSGRWNGQCLSISGPNAVNKIIEFPSTCVPSRNYSSDANIMVFGISMWVKLSRIVDYTNHQVLSIGSSKETGTIPLMGIGQATTPYLYWPSNLNTPLQGAFLSPASGWQWVDIRLALYPLAEARLNVRVDGITIVKDAYLYWGGDTMLSIADQLVFASDSGIDYMIDDLVIRAVSKADADWPLGPEENPTPDTMPRMNSQRIRVLTPTANGSVNQWSASQGQNYTAVASETAYVKANARNISDVYKFSLTGNEAVTALKYDGSSQESRDLQMLFAGQTVQPKFNASGFWTISEQNSGSPWTVATVSTSDFGQKS